jgi:YHS domain-containing protein
MMELPDAFAPLPEIGSHVLTACHGYITFDQDTQHIEYRGKRLFFCMKSCRRSFERDPQLSCLAGDPLLES